jgi:hypothetical protein
LLSWAFYFPLPIISNGLRSYHAFPPGYLWELYLFIPDRHTRPRSLFAIFSAGSVLSA